MSDKNKDKSIKEGFGGMNPGQGKLFPAVPERNFDLIAKQQRERKAKDQAKKQADALKAAEDKNKENNNG